MDFQRDFLRKVFYFKIKEINLKSTKHKKQNTKKNKRKQNHKVKFSIIGQTKVVRMEPTFMSFQWLLKSKFDKGLPKQ